MTNFQTKSNVWAFTIKNKFQESQFKEYLERKTDEVEEMELSEWLDDGDIQFAYAIVKLKQAENKGWFEFTSQGGPWYVSPTDNWNESKKYLEYINKESRDIERWERIQNNSDK